MKKPLVILSIFIISSFLFVGFGQILTAYNFEADSGLKNAGEGTGHINSGLWFGDKSLPEIIGKIISAILIFLGVIFLGLMIYGGYLWMAAHGNEQAVDKAKNIIRNALIGLIIVLAAYAITWTVYFNLG